ncbi:MAG: TonB C-terminal domain-containing protein [Acidobacteria bacterium]|nr:TonB C-terminal domain-containing protein [Acidobacteriota bacterium]
MLHELSHTGLVKEKYSRTLIVSVAIHAAVFLFAIFGQHLFPRKVIQIGTGIGGGTGGNISTVGVVDELSGGAGMVKPFLVPKPPALEEKPPESKSKAIPLPDTVERRIKPQPQTAKSSKTGPATNIIPTPAEKGSGGSGGYSGGSGGGVGGGIGVSIGAGSGGLGDHYYARAVEKRISDNWVHPPEGIRVDIVFRFYIDDFGNIRGVQKVKSSGNSLLDSQAERAILSIKDLTPPPAEFRGRLIQFSAHFVYPPDQQQSE